MKHINPYNEKGNPHGYWELYYTNSNLMFKGNYNDGKPYGYWEFYHFDGKLQQQIFFS
jgi:antitoxin component YwqK of YwqJK toxin-antitoxin module